MLRPQGAKRETADSGKFNLGSIPLTACSYEPPCRANLLFEAG